LKNQKNQKKTKENKQKTNRKLLPTTTAA